MTVVLITYMLPGVFFILLGCIHYLLTVVWQVKIFQSDWGRSNVPVSRFSNTAWSIVIAIWGIALLFAAWPIVAVLVMLSCFPILTVASRHDYKLYKRQHPNVRVISRGQWPELFQHWNLLRWWLISLIPLAVNAAIVYARNGIGKALILFFVCAAAATVTLDGLFTGQLLTNRGLYTREDAPIRYWISIAVVGAVYILGCVAAFLKFQENTP